MSSNHGVFNPQEFPDVIYTGASIELQPLPLKLFEILTLKEDWGKFASPPMIVRGILEA